MFLTKARLPMTGFFVIGVLMMVALLLTPYALVVAQESETNQDTAEVEPFLDSYCDIALAFSVDPMLEVAVRYSSGAERWFDEQCDLVVDQLTDLMEDSASSNSADAARWLAYDYEVQGFAPAPYDMHWAEIHGDYGHLEGAGSATENNVLGLTGDLRHR